MQGHRHGVFHVKEIALLFAIPKIGVVTFEQPDDALGLHLRRGFMDERPHVTLVALVRAKNIEEFQTDQAVQKAGAFGVQIKEVLRIAVHVQRTQCVQPAIIVVHAGRAVAISCGGRRINKPRFLPERPGGEVPGKFVIVADEKTGVGLGRGGAGAHVQHEVKFAQRAA